MKSRLLAISLVLGLALAMSHAQSDKAEYIVALRAGQTIAVVNKHNGTRTIQQVPDTSIYLLTNDTTTQDRVLDKLKLDPGVASAEVNRHIKLTTGDEAPPDTSLAQQMASLLDGQTLTTFYGTTVLNSYVNQPAVRITNLNEARSLSTGAATRVAFIDTGVDFNHPALRPWLDPGVDLVSGQSGSELDGLSQQMASLLDQQMTSLLDNRFSFILNQVMASLLDGGNDSGAFPSALGHGTMVAGIIHLFAPEARIVPIRAFDAYGTTTLFTLIDSIYRAKALNVDVINMSFSLNEDSDILRCALFSAQASGINLVASVGNDASESKLLYPAAYPGVVGVGATDFDDRLASFSNYGWSVSIMAPGAFVVSTVPGGRYAAAWGTSFSAPILSGTAALVASGRGRASVLSDVQLILATSDNIDYLNPGFERKLGRGRINVLRSLKVRR